MLRARRIGFTALDISAEQVDFVSKHGNKIYYGDASRLDLLRAAKAGKAVVFVLAIDDIDASLRTAETVRSSHFPEARHPRPRAQPPACLRADGSGGRAHRARHLLFEPGDGADDPDAASAFAEAEARRTVETFRDHDEKALVEMFDRRDDDECMVALSREWAKELEQIFERDAREKSLGDN